ncbi:MAG: dihydrodipicolinate reductase C-terminal domain-containing protein, partial [Candidatus Colwellbacteria bacterium]|nr:dihydrodipicolinate reductase C-terminal domain-containing protein [Candidatus Colwellbacteria bacterium]
MFIYVMVNGLPGKIATEAAKAIAKDERMELVKYSLTGEGIMEDKIYVEGVEITLIKPSEREKYRFIFEDAFQEMAEWKPFAIVDLTVPSAVNDNVKLYASHGFNFVVGTTGGDQEEMELDIRRSSSIAVIAPNMSIPIVIIQAMWKYAAKKFPGSLCEFSFEGWESHQKGKKDRSGTMRSFLPLFRQLGIDAGPENIDIIREPEDQVAAGVPEEFLGAHGWHDYDLSSGANQMNIYFGHNINGRATYTRGMIEAILFIYRKSLESTEKGRVYTMIDVISK